jgi:hypothetical protein
MISAVRIWPWRATLATVPRPLNSPASNHRDEIEFASAFPARGAPGHRPKPPLAGVAPVAVVV